MAQFLRPDSNVTQSSFTGVFADIDEATASDSDFAYGANNVAAQLEVGLSNPASTPGGGTTTVRYRVAKTNNGSLSGSGNGVDGTLSVYEGAVLVASDVARTLTGTWTDYSFAPDMSGVSDWNNLRLRFDTTKSGGGPSNRRGGAISWAELEAPDAAAGITGTMASQDSGADSFTASGGVAIAGTMSAQDTGSDSFSASGTISDPAISGTMASQDAGADTFASSGQLPIAGTMAVLESGGDSFAATGAVAIAGSMSVQEAGSDTFAATGSLASAITGTMAAQETGSDTVAAGGKVLIGGSMSASDAGQDTISIMGFISGAITGLVAIAEAGADKFFAFGVVPTIILNHGMRPGAFRSARRMRASSSSRRRTASSR